MRKLISLLFVCFWLAAAALGVHAAGSENGGFCLKVNPYGGEEAELDTICCRSTDEGLALFLPALEITSRVTNWL